MRIVFQDMYYPDFLDEFYAGNPGLEQQDYDRQWRLLMDRYFGIGDSYSRYFNEIGHQTQELVINCRPLQLKWAQENDYRLPIKWKSVKLPFGLKIPIPDGRSWYYPILFEQIKRISPDVFFMHNHNVFTPSQFDKIRKWVGKIVLQTTQLTDGVDLSNFDLIVTARPYFVDEFRNAGLHSEYFPLGFDSAILDRVKVKEKKYDLTFVGGISPAHLNRVPWLEEISRHFELDMWGYGVEFLSPEARKRIRYHGKIWGIDMFRVLAESRITLNLHLKNAKTYATNMRMYEATGMGAMLITEQMENLPGLFDPGREIVTFRDNEECCEMISRYLADDSERAKIARAGQERTLAEHTYAKRVNTLEKILLDLF